MTDNDIPLEQETPEEIQDVIDPEDIEIIEEIQQEDDNKAYSELLDRYQRSLAEFDNFRKRTLKEKSEAYDYGVQSTVEKLLPTLDNFERALAASENTEDTFFQGVAMIARQLENYLAELGVEEIKCETFDPNLHYAVAHVEDSAYGQGEIVEQLQKGYTYKGKLIRPSMVRVAN